MTDPKFSAFLSQDYVYSQVNGHNILATVLTPKEFLDEPPSSCPVLVYWHGGGFLTGHRMYAPWWPKWALEFAISKRALIVSPDHRLLPEAKGIDIIEDLHTFWSWMRDDLSSISDRETWHARPDLDRVACMGESSGGYLAMQSAFLCSAKVRLRAVISISSPLDTNARKSLRTVPAPRMILGSWPPPPKRAEAIIRGYIRGVKPGAVRTEGDPSAMWQLILSLVQQAWAGRLWGEQDNPLLNMTARIGELENLPPMWIIHSEHDSMVPLELSTKFADAMRRGDPNTPLLLTIRPGDHSFSAALTMREDWVQEGCRFIAKYWS